MLQTAVLLAGLGAALTFAGLATVRGEAISASGSTPWVEQHIQDALIPGRSYSLDGCVTVKQTGLLLVALRVVYYGEPGGFGSSLYEEDATADPWLIGESQCLSLTSAAPCAARSARYGVIVKGDVSAVEVAGLNFSVKPDATPVPCPTPSPEPVPTPTPTPSATPSPTPTAIPPPSPTQPPAQPTVTPQVEEPASFASLVNGGFEEVREDGTPYGWHKIGGEMSTSATIRAEGQRSATFVSRTQSTKWIFQAVEIVGGQHYRLLAQALNNGPGVREILLRISWYESVDGSGSQINTADSEAVTSQSSRFVTLDTGPVQAPIGARSARVRLLLRPVSTATASVYFDDVRFVETEAPFPARAVLSRQVEPPARGGESPAPAASPDRAPRAEAEALNAWAGPTPLVNVKTDPQPESIPPTAGGNPAWPLLLAFAAPAAAMATVAGHAWWKARTNKERRPPA